MAQFAHVSHWKVPSQELEPVALELGPGPGPDETDEGPGPAPVELLVDAAPEPLVAGPCELEPPEPPVSSSSSSPSSNGSPVCMTLPWAHATGATAASQAAARSAHERPVRIVVFMEHSSRDPAGSPAGGARPTRERETTSALG
jgi:hypothetical protein